MKRILAIWLPNWPIQRLISIRPELEQQPVILQRSDRRGQCVAFCSHAAWQLGVRVPMSASEAVALVQPSSESASLKSVAGRQELHLQQYDPIADREALHELAHWCQRFSPMVGLEGGLEGGLEAAEQPETLLLDVTGLPELFGGERALIWQVAQELKQRHFFIHAAMADTIGAAWALAHYGVRLGQVCSDQTGERSASDSSSRGPCGPSNIQGRTWVLRSHPLAAYDLPRFHDLFQQMPVQALRLPEETVQLLRRLGIRHLDHLQALPRTSLSSRFGPLLLKRLDQAMGIAAEMIHPSHPPADLTVTWSLEYPTQQRDLLDQIFQHLIHRLTLLLLQRGVGALQFVCRMQFQSAPSLSRQVGLFQPSSRPQHLWELMQSSLERVRLPGPVTEIQMQVTRQGSSTPRQLELFEGDRANESASELALLIDRLAARLGHKAITRPRLRNDAQPELAYELNADFRSRSASFKARHSRSVTRNPLDRPFSLMTRPIPIQVTALIPDESPRRFWFAGRPYQVSRCFGPERIETGWHRRRGIRRDYYQVETTEGERFWLFRNLQNNQWFLHGRFS